MNYKNNILSKIEKVPRGIQGYGHIIKNVFHQNLMYEWILLGIDFIFEFNKTSYSVCLQMYLIMGQNMQVDKENKVSKDALQKSDGQLNIYM